MEKIDTVVVGGGQAGIAMSEHLNNLQIPHVVLERGRVAERWRSARWDSLVANGPAWHDRFPNLTFSGVDPDSFVPKERVADYFVTYAKKIHAPIRTGVEVQSATRSGAGFIVKTSAGSIEAKRLIAATGAFQKPLVPPIAPPRDAIPQIHARDYHNPEQLPAGAVMVIGAGASGSQIADELQRAGRHVYLSVGAHNRPPRFYRGLDYDWWLGVTGEWDTEASPTTEHVTIAVSGARGGFTVDFRKFAQQGITLVGVTKAFEDGTVFFNDDLPRNIKHGDENYLSLLDAADAYASKYGLDLPSEPSARVILPDPECITHPILSLDLQREHIASIVWATGYTTDFSWLDVDVFDQRRQPLHKRGVSPEPGLYFLGLPFLISRSSSFIWGVWHDAKYVADHIARQRRYETYYAERVAAKIEKRG